MRDPVAWILYSPGRLIVSSAIVVGLLAGVICVSALGRPEVDDEPARDATSSETRKNQPSAVEPSVGKAAGAIDGFLSHFLQDEERRPAEMPGELRKFTTPALWRGLRHTDVDALPAHAVVEVKTEALGPSFEAYSLTLRDGRVLWVEAVVTGVGWRVADVRLDESP